MSTDIVYVRQAVEAAELIAQRTARAWAGRPAHPGVPADRPPDDCRQDNRRLRKEHFTFR
jgi:hypothetical protein